MELNLKMKTQLSITEKEKLNLCNIAEEEAFHPKIAPRSQSGNHKKSLANILPQHQHNVQSLFNNPLSKEVNSTHILETIDGLQKDASRPEARNRKTQ